MNEFSRILRGIRIDTGLSQKDFANKLGMKPVAYNMVESGKNQPSYTLLTNLVEVFSVDANRLFNINDSTLNEKVPKNEADFLNLAQERAKKINYLYQSLISIRLLLFQELKIKSELATKAEADLLNTLARPNTDSNEFRYPYNDLDEKGKEAYLKDTESCITLFTNTFFDCFDQLYKGIIIPYDKELRGDFLSKRQKVTDNWKYSHVFKEKQNL